MDPGSVPAELKGLSQTEEMLIARCCPIMRVVHLKGGQLGYGGHVVNVAQDITTFAATLPRLAADVPIIILRREGQEPGQYKDLHVRRVRVQGALIWLIANNPYYRDIVLDDTALSQLPVHGQLRGLRSTVSGGDSERQKRVLEALFHLRCPSQSHQRSARGRTRLMLSLIHI